MTDVATDLGKGALGIGIGFALYLLVSGLGSGGRARAGRGGVQVPQEPSLPTLPARTKDEKRLTFVMQGPEIVGLPMVFRLSDDDPSPKVYAFGEMLERIKSGGRSDVNLKIRGGVIQGPADEAVARLTRAGIQVWKADSADSSARVSGNPRGAYGWRQGTRAWCAGRDLR